MRASSVMGVPDALTGKAGDAAELVGGDALVAVGVDQAPYDLDQLLFVGIVRIVEAENASPGLFHALDLEGGREDGHFILMPGEDGRLLQPGDGGLHPRIIGGRVPDELVLLVLEQDLPGGGDDLPVHALLAVQVSQTPEDSVYFRLGQAGPGGHAVLPLDVLVGVEQDAVGGVVVPAGPAGLLEVVLQGPRNVGVDHQADIGLVYSHPEGIGGGDRFQPALDEVVLHLLLALRSQPGMEVVCLSPFVVQEPGNPLGVPPGRAVDDGPTLEVGGQVALKNVVQVGQLPGLISLNNPELKVGPLRATVYDFEVDLPGFPGSSR